MQLPGQQQWQARLSFSLAYVAQSCLSMTHLKQIHGRAVVTNLQHHVTVLAKMFRFAAISPSGTAETSTLSDAGGRDGLRSIPQSGWRAFAKVLGTTGVVLGVNRLHCQGQHLSSEQQDDKCRREKRGQRLDLGGVASPFDSDPHVDAGEALSSEQQDDKCRREKQRL
ncbi:hypothetical protein ACFX2B_023463 [Malus domestica]